MAAGRTSKGFLALAVAAAAIAFGGCGGDEAGGSNTLTWFIFNEPSASPQTAAEKCAKESGGEYEIEFEFLPADADGQREQLVRRLGAEDDTIDLIGMDVIWTGEFASAGWIVPVPEATAQVVSKDVFPSVLETAKFEGTLYAAPLWSNTELLWYRSDLVKQPPKTWDEMIDEAESLNPDENLIQVQANKYEGLVVWFNQMVESAGGQVLSGPTSSRSRRTDDAGARGDGPAIDLGGRRPGDHDLAGGPQPARLPDRKLRVHDQLPVRLPERRGRGARHLQGDEGGEVPGDRPRDPVGAAARRRQPRRLGLLREPGPRLEGGRVPGRSREPARDRGGRRPTPVREDLYDSKQIEKVYPGFSQIIGESIADAAARPSESPAYQDISAIQNAVHPTTEIDPDDPSATYDELRELLEQAINREGLL